MLTDLQGDVEQRRQGLESIRHALRRIRDILQRIGELREAGAKSTCPGIRMLDLSPVGRMRRGRWIAVKP